MDFVCGPDAYRDLPQLLESVLKSIAEQSDGERQKAANTLLSMEETYADIRPVRRYLHTHYLLLLCVDILDVDNMMMM